jgi:ubiquinone/menaquinone biosynthesis C-methylase UbiE
VRGTVVGEEVGIMESGVHFGAVSGAGDDNCGRLVSRAVRELAFSAAGVKPGTIAANIGSGTESLANGLVSLGVRVIAVDQSGREAARIRRTHAADGRIDCRPGSVESLPIADDSVDYVFANMCFRHATDPAAAIAEMVRVMKRGGVLVITDLDQYGHRTLAEGQNGSFVGFTREEIRCWMIEAGLRAVVVTCMSGEWDASSPRGRQGADIFIASGTKG